MDNPDSSDSLGSDQLSVDLLSPRSKRSRTGVNCDRRDGTPDGKNTNNNDVGFVMIEESPENGTEEDDDVGIQILFLRFD